MLSYGGSNYSPPKPQQRWKLLRAFSTLCSIRDYRGFPQRAHRAATSVVGGGAIAHDSVLQEENTIMNQEVLRHLNAILFDARVHNAWSYDQLPMVQRIMNTEEKTTTGVTPAELILNNSIRLSSSILAALVARNSSTRFAFSDTMDTWIQTLIKAVQ